jgi:magnesium chelatase accessory protein
MLESFYPPMPWDTLKAQWPNAQHSQFINTTDVRWHVQMFGDGPALLLLHGLGSSTHTWRAIAPFLSKHYQVIAVDVPGHAFSSIPSSANASFVGMTKSLRELMDALHIWPFGVIGHSAGACLAAKLILNAPNLPSPALIALNPAWLPLPGLANWMFPVSAKLIALNPMSAWLFAKHLSKDLVIHKILSSTGSQLREDDIFFYRVLMQSPSHLKGVLQMMSRWDLGDLPEQLSQLKSRVLIQAGINDLTIPFGHAVTSHHKIKQSQLQALSDLGHLAHEEKPQACAEQILDWLEIKQMGH